MDQIPDEARSDQTLRAWRTYATLSAEEKQRIEENLRTIGAESAQVRPRDWPDSDRDLFDLLVSRQNMARETVVWPPTAAHSGYAYAVGPMAAVMPIREEYADDRRGCTGQV